MILNVSSHKTEEFRRAALRRRSRGAVEVEDLQQHHLHQAASHTGEPDPHDTPGLHNFTTHSLEDIAHFYI